MGTQSLINAFVAVIFSLMPSFVMAEGRALTLSEYLDGTVRAGDVVCEVVQNTCYLTLNYNRTLTEKEDPSGALKKGAINKDQRQFTRVTIEQIMAELERGKVKANSPIDIYVKVNWEARDNGPLAKHLGQNHIVHGQLRLTGSGAFEFEVTNIPDMVLLGMYYPSLDVAEVFGGKIGKDNERIERDMKRWLKVVLTAVIPQALVSMPSLP